MRIPWLTARWEQAERHVDAAEQVLNEAREQYDHVLRLTDESRAIKKMNGFTEKIRAAMGVTDGGTAPRPGHRHA